jgi:hypothetical protein
VPVFLLAVPSPAEANGLLIFSRLRPFLAGTLAAHWILINLDIRGLVGRLFFRPPLFLRRDTAVRALFNTRFLTAPFQAKACPVLPAGCGQFCDPLWWSQQPAVFDWNRTPIRIDQNPKRVWDWSDIAFFR